MLRFLKEVTLPYLIYLMFFLGVGLLSGSVVHFPQAPLRYFIIGATGAIIFTIGAILTETVIHHRNLLKEGGVLRFILCTLVLSLGIGMISGAIQHFQDIPLYASYLIPLGFVISLISYVLKENIPLSRRNSTLLLVKIMAIGLPLWLILQATAAQIPVAGGHSHGGNAQEPSASGLEPSKQVTSPSIHPSKAVNKSWVNQKTSSPEPTEHPHTDAAPHNHP